MVNTRKKKQSNKTNHNGRDTNRSRNQPDKYEGSTSDLDSASSGRSMYQKPASPSCSTSTLQSGKGTSVNRGEKGTEVFIDVTPSCSNESNVDDICEDGLLSFLSLSSWDRLETLCEIIQLLNPYELKLMASCIESAIKAQGSVLRSHEERANNPEAVTNLISRLSVSFPDAVECTFSLVALLNTFNRQAAFAYFNLIMSLLNDRKYKLPELPDSVKLSTLDTLGRIVVASLHHPAFTVDQRIYFTNVREQLRTELEQLKERMQPKVMNNVRPNLAASPLLFIRHFKARALESVDSFVIEMIWNDGERTFANRSRHEIAEIHHKLLDMFGEERKDVVCDLENLNSDNEQCLTPPASTSRAGSLSSRILPYFKLDAPVNVIVDYVNGLSDLPARMMLSSVIYEEFYSTRYTSQDVEACDRRTPSRSARSPPASSNTPIANGCSHNSSIDETFADDVAPVAPSCSNCSEDHLFVHCNKKSMCEGGPQSDSFRQNGVSNEREREIVRVPGNQIIPMQPMFIGDGAQYMVVPYVMPFLQAQHCNPHPLGHNPI